MTGARLGLSGVACIRGDRLLFEGIDFAIAAGGALCVTGPNGVGKSSLLRIAGGLLRPSAGHVEATGGVAWLGDVPALDPYQPLRHALGYWAAIDTAPKGAVDAALETMGIAALADVPVRMLSTGQRKRAGLARVLLGRAMIWLLDEPANGLDAATLDRLSSTLADHRRAGGIVAIATHQPIALENPLVIALETPA